MTDEAKEPRSVIEVYGTAEGVRIVNITFTEVGLVVSGTFCDSTHAFDFAGKIDWDAMPQIGDTRTPDKEVQDGR
jgi:hypothetical protein